MSKAWKFVWMGLGVLALAAVGLVARAQWVMSRSYVEVPYPPIRADHSPAGVARGEMLFQSLCMECHGGSDGRASGKRLDEIPAFLGRFWSANLAHPARGVQQRSDAELARVLRTGVLPDGQLSAVMNGFGKLGDADVAALIGYMRSGAAAFSPGGAEQPHSEVSLVGAMIMTYIAKLSTDAPASGVRVPPKAATVDYGRYMANAMDCGGCHTAGFAPDKVDEPGAFAGQFELTDPTGAAIFTKNITFDPETGIGQWSVDDLDRAVRRGVGRDGFMVRKPMPQFSRLDRTDIEAIYAFLQTVPKVHQPNRAGGHPLKKARSNDPPEVLFVNLGCVACHGDNGPYRAALSRAAAKSDSDVARWILDPQSIKPGAAMPSFEAMIDRSQAEDLAKYVKSLVAEHG